MDQFGITLCDTGRYEKTLLMLSTPCTLVAFRMARQENQRIAAKPMSKLPGRS
jgi:hypothetical protein